MTNRNEIIEPLNDLLQKNIDAYRGYEKTAANVDHPSFKSYLNNRAAQRQRFANEIEKEIVSLGGSPKREVTVKGSLHHAWIDFKSTLSFDDPESMMEECIRGERTSVDAYNDKLKAVSWPTSTYNMITRQRDQVVADLEKAKMLEEVTG